MAFSVSWGYPLIVSRSFSDAWLSSASFSSSSSVSQSGSNEIVCSPLLGLGMTMTFRRPLLSRSRRRSPTLPSWWVRRCTSDVSASAALRPRMARTLFAIAFSFRSVSFAVAKYLPDRSRSAILSVMVGNSCGAMRSPAGETMCSLRKLRLWLMFSRILVTCSSCLRVSLWYWSASAAISS